MQTKIIEASNSFNWGKFLLGRFELHEWARQSAVSPEQGLLRACGWGPLHLWVLDLQTGEGAFFKVGGNAHADLNKHKIWVCPLFEPFLEWLYQQKIDFETLPDMVELPHAEPAFHGYRRPGPTT